MDKPRIRVIDNVYYIVRTNALGQELKKKAAIENGELVFGANGNPLTVMEYAGVKAGRKRKANQAANSNVPSAPVHAAPQPTQSEQIDMVTKSFANIGKIASPCLMAQILAVSIDIRALNHFPSGGLDPIVQVIAMRKDPKYAIRLMKHGPICDEAAICQINRDITTVRNVKKSKAAVDAAVARFDKEIRKLDLRTGGAAFFDRGFDLVVNGYDYLEAHLTAEIKAMYQGMTMKLWEWIRGIESQAALGAKPVHQNCLGLKQAITYAIAKAPPIDFIEESYDRIDELWTDDYSRKVISDAFSNHSESQRVRLYLLMKNSGKAA